jgi:hypothetical protein
MQRQIDIGTISWIAGTPNPMNWAIKAAVLNPSWVPKTYLGLAATANAQPSATVADFRVFQKTKAFRALTYCRLQVEIDDKTDKFVDFKVLDATHDGGWTPPFKMSKWPSTALSFDKDIYSSNYYAGEASPISLVNGRARHKNTAISGVAASEVVLVNSLIKFRAGSHTDNIGTKTVGAPFHVPWVWCEVLLTYTKGALKVYGRGSVFPSHAWYLDGKRVFVQNEIGDATFPKKSTPSFWGTVGDNLGVAGEIDVPKLTLYPVLSAGAPASGPQSSLGSETSLKGSVDTHPNTASGAALRFIT